MAGGIIKYAPIHGGNFISDFKSHFSILRTKRTVALAYTFVSLFIAFTIFLAFSPSSSNSSSPWFTNVFTSAPSDRSHFSSVYNYFFPNSPSLADNVVGNQTQDDAGPYQLEPNNAASVPQKNPPVVVNNPVNNTSNNTTPPTPSPELIKGASDANNRTKAQVLNKNQSPNYRGGIVEGNQARNGSKGGVLKKNNQDPNDKGEVFKENQAPSQKGADKVEASKANQSAIGVTKSKEIENKSLNPPLGAKNIDPNEKGVADKGGVYSHSNNFTSSLTKKQQNGSVKNRVDDPVQSLINCDLFDGNWVKDESYPLYNPGSCSLIDEQFNCFLNGRPDNGYLKLKWKPKGCTLPRLNGSHMLELLRGKRLVFVGDSLNRNMWESLICILRNSVKDQKKVYEELGRHHFRSEASYSFVFEDYKCTVEFFVAPFLVQEWEVPGKNGTKKETLRLDLISRSADKYKNADIIVFNTGHWWTHEKTSLGKDYYQEGSHVYSDLNVLEAFRKAITTWGRWIDTHVNPKKSFVFFRGYSASHFSGGQWNSGGQCDHETEPIKNDTYLTPYPPKMIVLEKVFRGMKTSVSYLNVTRMTDYRKDGHPSIYRKQHMMEEERKLPLKFQDCSHWCLPGVPDAWNEVLYAELLVKLHGGQQKQKGA